MKKALLGPLLLVMLVTVGCESKESEKPKQIIKEAIKQEQQVDEHKEEVKEEPKKVEIKEKPQRVEKELPKKTEKELPKKEVEKEPESGLIKDGTHLEEEAKEQEEEGIIEPEEDYNEPDYDDDWLREYGNTEEFGDYDDYSKEYEEFEN